MPDRTERPTGGQPDDDDADGAHRPTLVASTERWPVATVRIASLTFAGSPRLSGADPEHIRLLAEAQKELPPIMVHRPTMRVIDGTHRVQAALLNGNQVIEARLLDCDEDAAFVLSVTANITHGLPLSRLERKAAAARIIASHPHWSDRAVAAAVGLSDKTISKLRSSSTTEDARTNSRIGRDGRQHPLSTEDKRRQAAAIIAERPEAGLREIARTTGLSPTTVRDVRKRVERNEDPVPPKFRSTARVRPAAALPHPPRALRTVPNVVHPDPHTLLAGLLNDPALRFNETGRRTLRWLHQHLVDAESWDRERLSVPDHCTPMVANLARSCAQAWKQLADELDRRVRDGDGAAS